MSTTITVLSERVKCIGENNKHYPGSPFEIGDILVLDKYADGKEKYGLFNDKKFPEFASILLLKSVVDDHPHLFQKLDWWQELTPEQIPDYLKESDPLEGGGSVVWVYKNKKDFDYVPSHHAIDLKLKNDKRSIHLQYLKPATKEEYDLYTQKPK